MALLNYVAKYTLYGFVNQLLRDGHSLIQLGDVMGSVDVNLVLLSLQTTC